MALAALVEEARNELRLELIRDSNNNNKKDDAVSHSILEMER